jgi:hypothetical protein
MVLSAVQQFAVYFRSIGIDPVSLAYALALLLAWEVPEGGEYA